MGNTEVIVDTCFLSKISKDYNNIDNIKLILDELGFKPVLHPYVYENEIHDSKIEKLIKSGFIRVASYDEIFEDAYDKKLYEGYFNVLYKDLFDILEAGSSQKNVNMYPALSGIDIYNNHRQGSSLGDVHMILMALFLNIPIMLSEDSDIELLRTIADRRIKLKGDTIHIMNSIDVIKKVAALPNPSITKKELINIIDQIGERRHRSEIKEIWNRNHE